jgi:hypothetical protein
MAVGIYKLEFTDGSFYVGKSLNIDRRFKYHKWCLLNNLSARKLQDKYFETGFPVCTIIEYCAVSEIDKKEIFWIQELNALNKGLNTATGGSGAAYGQYNVLSKYSLENIVEVLYLLSDDNIILLKEIAESTGVHKDTVSSIACGKTHCYLKELFPERYAILESRIGTRNSVANNVYNITYPDIKSPEGKVYSITNGLSYFANTHKLNKSALCQVLKGKSKQHKGWKLATES